MGVALCAASALRAQLRSDQPKNVLLLMSDQHKRDCMGAAGDPVARTPNLDRLASTSVRFTNAYCSNPVCTPSRASLLTGLLLMAAKKRSILAGRKGPVRRLRHGV